MQYIPVGKCRREDPEDTETGRNLRSLLPTCTEARHYIPPLFVLWEDRVACEGSYGPCSSSVVGGGRLYLPGIYYCAAEQPTRPFSLSVGITALFHGPLQLIIPGDLSACNGAQHSGLSYPRYPKG